MSRYQTQFQGNPTHLDVEHLAKCVRDNSADTEDDSCVLAEAYLDLLTLYEKANEILKGLAEKFGDEVESWRP